MSKNLRAFTLIELLVVITIIVVLLALLTPALDKAIYQAELATCMANLRGVAGGAQSYAIAQKRFYPYRPSIERGYWNRPTNLCDSVEDDRPIMDGYVEMKSLVDPLCPRVDLRKAPAASHVFSSYNLWFGTSFTDESRQYAGLKRLGSRLSFQERGTGGKMHRFDVLAGDLDSIYEYGNYGVFTSHADKEGVLSPASGEGTNASGIGTVPIPAASSYGPDVFTLSRWQKLDRIDRGPLDLHFVYGDGSVRRFEDVAYDEKYRGDSRMFDLPVQTRGAAATGTGYPLYWDHIPLR